MIRTKEILMLALLFPILALLILTFYKRHILMSGQEITLPITGYDPRDLLSGHYVTYQVEYGIPNICSGFFSGNRYICLENKSISSSPLPGCKQLIHGICHQGQFDAGIEKYYIPESKADYLNQQIRAKKASIVISVTPNGEAQVKDLLIEGQSWQQN